MLKRSARISCCCSKQSPRSHSTNSLLNKLCRSSPRMALTGISGRGSAKSRGRGASSASFGIQKTTRRPSKQKTSTGAVVRVLEGDSDIGWEIRYELQHVDKGRCPDDSSMDGFYTTGYNWDERRTGNAFGVGEGKHIWVRQAKTRTTWKSNAKHKCWR